jgi:hypothetical protein
LIIDRVIKDGKMRVKSEVGGLNGRSRIFGLLVLFTAVFCAGCFDPVSPSQGTVTGSNVLVVQIAGEFMASRTALPSAPVSAQYTIGISGKGGSTLPKGTGGPYFVQLTAAPTVGDIVTVESLDGADVKNAKGSHTLTADDLGGTPVNVTLRLLEEGYGNVDLEVRFDPGSGSDEITLAELSLYSSLADYTGGLAPHSTARYGKNGYDSGPDWTDFAGASPEIIPLGYSNLPWGNYVVKIEFFRGPAGSPTKVSRLLQAINVRGGLTTDTWVESSTDTLTWDAFGSSNANLGADGIKLDGNTVPGYNPATYTYNIYEATTSTPPDKFLTITVGEPGQVIAAKLNGSAVNLTKNGLEFTGALASLQLKNSLEIKVTAPDGLTEKTYTVNISGKEIIDFYFTIGGKNYGVVTGAETDSGNITGTTITITVPYGTNLTNLAPTVIHSGASISPDGTSWGSLPGPHTYTVTAEDSTQQAYTVTVNPKPGITISGITVESWSALTFSGVPTSPVDASDPLTSTITITISGGGGTVTNWYIDVNGPVTPTSSTTNTVAFARPSTPGFYNVNVIATVGGVDYSGSFGLIVK